MSKNFSVADMAMYVQMFRTIVKNRHVKGELSYEEFRVLRRQIVLAELEFRKIYAMLLQNHKNKRLNDGV